MPMTQNTTSWAGAPIGLGDLGDGQRAGGQGREDARPRMTGSSRMTSRTSRLDDGHQTGTSTRLSIIAVIWASV